MRCSSCEPLLDRYIEGTLTPRQMLAVSSHLKTCDACTVLIQELRVVDALLSTTKPVELAPNFTFAVMAEARTTPIARPRRFAPWAWLSFYLISAWVMIGGAYLGFGSRAPWLANGVGGALSLAREAGGAIVGVAHGLGAGSPLVIAAVFGVLAVDALLAGGLIFFHRSIHPRLAAALARQEAS